MQKEIFDRNDENVPKEIAPKIPPRLKRVTPEWAARVLNRAANNVNNRTISGPLVAAYARDMVDGKWINAHPGGIVFDENGFIIDGFHRLRAVVLSERTIWMWVHYAKRKEMADSIDVGKIRSIDDLSKIDGTPYRNDHAAVVRKMEYGPRLGSTIKLTKGQVRELIGKYWAAMKIVEKSRNHRLSSTVRTALARASVSPASEEYMGRNELQRVTVFQRLCEFLEIFSSGHVKNDGDLAAITLYRYIQNHLGHYTPNDLCKMYMATEIAIQAFLEKKRLEVINVMVKGQYRNKELFPIAEDGNNPRFEKIDTACEILE
jgi:hypothetical protein